MRKVFKPHTKDNHKPRTIHTLVFEDTFAGEVSHFDFCVAFQVWSTVKGKNLLLEMR